MTTKDITKLLVQKPLPFKHYYQTMCVKTQLVVHHTGGGTGNSAWNWFQQRNGGIGTISVPYIIEPDGSILNLFQNMFQFGYHLGVAGKSNLDKASIPTEIVNWGFLKEEEIGKKVKENEVVEYSTPFRGFKLFHKYTEAQIDSLYSLLKTQSFVTSIPLNYQYDQFFKVSKKALAGEKGLYSHCSYRADKTDCHPQPELIQMLTAVSST